jgi:hypothetical protein
LEPISTVLAGYALVKQSVDFIKGNIETVNDIRSIFGHVDNLLNGEQQIQQARFGDKSLIGQTKDAASSVIDAKLAQEAIDEMRSLINFRFGPNTWKEIVDERAKRLQEEKELIEQERKARIKRKAELQKKIMLFATGGIGILLMIIGMFALIYFTGGI